MKTHSNKSASPTPPLPTVEELATQLLIFECESQHELVWGLDVSLQLRDGEWRLTRIPFEGNETNPDRFYIGGGMTHGQAYAIARAMILNVSREVR